jgi:DNA polymerase-3 subunit epsilon
MGNPELEESIAALEATGEFRVLRKAQLEPIPLDLSSEQTRLAIVVDTETTGLDIQRDEIVEIGMLAFPYDRSGRVGSVISTFSALR